MATKAGAGRKRTTELSAEVVAETDVVVQQLMDIGQRLEVLAMTVGADFEMPTKALEGEPISVEEQYADSLESLGDHVAKVIDLRVQVVQRDALVREGNEPKEGA